VESKPAEVVLQVEKLTLRGKFQDITFELRRGEIVGVAGLIGSGRSQLLRALFGAQKPDSGHIFVHGRPVSFRSPRDAMRRQMAYLPEDRKRHAVLLDMTVQDNITLPVVAQLGAGVFRVPTREAALAKKLAQRLDVRTPSMRTRIKFLSGGNQQKVLVARWLAMKPDIVLLDEPTIGIDVGARVEIYRIIEDMARDGAAILFVSSDLDEVLGISHRILVMSEGRLTGDFARTDVNRRTILHHAFGGSSRAAS
jgi:ABC-type sugar transport system ATPase subunit